MSANVNSRAPATTFLTHYFGRGLIDKGECYVVERFRAMTNGEIRRWPGETPTRSNGRGRPKPEVASVDAVPQSRKDRSSSCLLRLTHHAISAARPRASEYTLWDSALNHFGLRVYPSGVRSFIVQIRVQGRMRKITLGRFPATGIAEARKQAAALLARIWSGKPIAPVRKPKEPLFRDFAIRYRERRKDRWKPSSLETFDIYLRNRLMPHFGRLRLDTIDNVRVSAWFDAASAEKPSAANRAFEILRAMLNTARQWGELGESAPDACANIVKNPRKPVARYLTGVLLCAFPWLPRIPRERMRPFGKTNRSTQDDAAQDMFGPNRLF